MGAFAIGSLCLHCRPLIAVFSAGQSGTRRPPGKKKKQKNKTEASWGGFHHEEGAPTLLFLMVASEHSASDVSQSESPNWSGFYERDERDGHRNISTEGSYFKHQFCTVIMDCFAC